MVRSKAKGHFITQMALDMKALGPIMHEMVMVLIIM